MKHLWSPWRMKYIAGHDPKKHCVFCEAANQPDETALIVFRGHRAYVILNRFPYTSGHLMIIPFDHLDSIEALPDESLTEMMTLGKRSLAALRAAYRAPAFNLGANIGEAAGAGVAGHVHLHVVPRWPGDTNFMTSLGEVRVLPEELAETWAKLRAVWQ